ncbi:MAG TPA: YCF48-related protein, partial [Candidatus Limnocylindria bacterium]|nr:YCF48-related protein [Candidatus Limnocylindria bacterium]
MKVRYVCFLSAFLLAFLPGVGSAQSGFHSIYSIDGTDVWGVGDAGVYYRSYDGGVSYTTGTLGNKTLRGVVHRGLTAIVVGDSGKVWRSTNNGGAWSIYVAGDATNLRAVELPSDLIAYAVGDAGKILKSVDGGVNWGPQTSGTALALNAVKFTSDLDGWAVGNGGTVLHTTDGGANWNPVATGATNDLLAVDALGSDVWVVGRYGTALNSTNSGGNWSFVNLKLDAKADVRAVTLQAGNVVYLAGGGGFIRKSTDGGATWTFLIHDIQAPITDAFFTGNSGWVCSRTNRVMARTTNGGTNWSFPTGATVGRSWALKQSNPSGDARGHTIGYSAQNPNALYALMGGVVFKSLNEGENWTQIATIPGGTQSNAFFVSPKDSNMWVAAVTGSDRVVRTINAGANWTTTLTHSFGEWGIPMGIHPDKPDTLFFGGDSDVLYRSTDFGATWSTWGSRVFRSPCDIVVVPESDSGVVLIGDGITSSGLWDLMRSNDHGASFKIIAQGTGSGSEVPGMANSRLRPNTTFATAWSSNGVRRTTNAGLGWTQVHTSSSAWGVDVAADDPNVVVFGRYSGGTTHLALDGGPAQTSFLSISLGGTNYSFLARDRALILALQAAGIYKLNVTYSYATTSTQSLTLTAPNGGEVWPVGSQRNVTWNSQNVGLARIEYRTAPADPWQLVAEVPGYLGTYAWTIPCTPTATAEVRVRDAWDAAPEDLSNSSFTISGAQAASNPTDVDFSSQAAGGCYTQVVTIQNAGNTTLNATVAVAGAPYHVGRGSLSVGPGLSDTVGVTFCPTSAGTFPDTLVLTSNACGAGPLRIPITGTATSSAVVNLTLPLGGESWEWNTEHELTWTSTNVTNVALDYRVAPGAGWNAIVASVPASQEAYTWTIPNAPADSAQVRVRDVGGTTEDLSDYFRILVPMFGATPDPLDLGSTNPGTPVSSVLTVQNRGGAD